MPLERIRAISRLWMQDDLLRRLAKNSGVLLSGNIIASILGLGTLALAAGGLGPEQYGILVLVTTYVAIIDQIINFQSWQAVIKYGAEAIENKRSHDFKSLIKFCVFLDSGSAFLGMVVAYALCGVAGWLMNWSADTTHYACLYGVVILFNLSGTPMALLRLLGHFKLYAIQQVIAAVIRLAGAGFAWWMDAGLEGFLIVWAGTEIIGHCVLMGMGLWALRHHGFHGIRHAKLTDVRKTHPGIWRFVVTTNLNASLRMLTRQLDVMIVGSMLGSAATGLYHVAKQISSVLLRLSDPLYHSIFPDLSRLAAKGEYAKLLLLVGRSSLLAGALALTGWAGFIIIGPDVLTLLFGEAYVAAMPVLAWYMLSIAIGVFAFPLQPALLSLGGDKHSLTVSLITTVLYFPVLAGLLHLYALPGAGMANVVFMLSWVGLMSLFILHSVRQRRAADMLSHKPEVA